jgi:hypothetical protein
MNSRALTVLAVLVAAIIGAAFWFLGSAPVAPLGPIAFTTPPPVEERPPGASVAQPPGEPPKPDMPADAEAVPKPTVPAPIAITEEDEKIDQILRANPENTDAANTATAQMLINLMPTLSADGQAEAAQHVANLLEDKEFTRVAPIVKNPATPEEVLDVLVTDLMNRDDAVKLPTLLDIAKTPNHPMQEEALTDLEIFLDEDYGNDWPKWDAAMKAYLKKQADEEAGVANP